jgi:hypothetical protein
MSKSSHRSEAEGTNLLMLPRHDELSHKVKIALNQNSRGIRNRQTNPIRIMMCGVVQRMRLGR